MKTINHKYIIKVYEILSSTQKIIFSMEYIEGGDLFEEIKNGKEEKLPEEKSRYYFQQIITALEYCHNKNIIHRDLKPENILIDKKENCIKISDFGLATILKEKNEKLNDFCGTTNYIAPEIIKETGGIFSNGGYEGQPVDIWSSGVILYNMVSGENPFYHRNKTVRINNILNANINYPKYFSKELVDLLKKIFVTQPKNRFTIKDIKKHSWFNKNFVDINQIFDYGNIVKVNSVNSKNFDIGENNIRKLNSFEFISMIAGKWLNNMFIDDKGDKRICFENKDKYKFFMKNTFKELSSFFINFFQSYNEDIHFLNVDKGKWNLKIKFNTQINSSISELIIYKLGNSNKYIICFNFLEGNKISFIRMIKSLYNTKNDNLLYL
jgi:5'-AMP-activated protein kinase catalytic alpha subunit